MAYDDEIPTPADMREWLGPMSADDATIQFAIDGETEAQGRVCDWPGRDTDEPRPRAMTLALYRRTGRALAARGAALGIIGADSEYGAVTLTRWDAEIERYEVPYRVVSIA